MIRILHSVSNMDRAGIETMLMNYYRNINHEEIQFDFLCNKKKIGAYEEEIKKMGGRIYRTPGLNPIKFFKYKKFMKKLFAEHPEYKIIHGHNGAFSVYALYCAKLSKVPVRIFHGHNSALLIDLKYPLKLFCKSKIKSTANQFWACGYDAAKFYFDKNILENYKYTIVKNAVDLNKFSFNEQIRNKIRKDYNVEDKFIIGHIGRFSKVKNHKFLINLFEKYYMINKDSLLVLVGDGEEEQKIKRIVEEKSLNDKVLFLGNIQNVYEWYQAFDVFILPSLNEGLPVVGVEAQAADLPCVFSTGVPFELKYTEKVKFVSLSESVETWCKEIDDIRKKYCERRNNYELVSENGYNIALEAKKLERKYIELYNKAIIEG